MPPSCRSTRAARSDRRGSGPLVRSGRPFPRAAIDRSHRSRRARRHFLARQYAIVIQIVLAEGLIVASPLGSRNHAVVVGIHAAESHLFARSRFCIAARPFPLLCANAIAGVITRAEHDGRDGSCSVPRSPRIAIPLPRLLERLTRVGRAALESAAQPRHALL